MPHNQLRPKLAPAPAEEAPVQWGQFAEVISSGADAVLCLGEDMTVRFANAAAATIFGYAPEEFESLPLDRLIPPSSREVHRDHVHAFLKAPERARLMADRKRVEGVRKDGTAVPLRISILKHAASGPFHVTAIIRDISRFVACERDLRRALERARAADVAKTQLLANVSHELKTPLNAIIGFADLLAGKNDIVPDPSQVPGYAGYIADSGRHLLALLEEIIIAARLEADRVRPVVSDISLDDLVATSVSAVGELAQAAGTSVTVAPSPEMSVEADERLLRLALWHVLVNAIRFGRKGGTVAVHAEVAREAVRLVVEDDGPGMDIDELRRAGEPFFQSDAGMTRRSGGLGLGLFTARRILKLHGGTLDITSTIGEGTSVALSIPRTSSTS